MGKAELKRDFAAFRTSPALFSALVIDVDGVSVPGRKIGGDSFQIITAKQRPALVKKHNLDGVKQLELGFVDDRLVHINVVYDDSIKWGDAKQFATQLSKTLNLPNTWGTYFSPDSNKTWYLHCVEFDLEFSWAEKPLWLRVEDLSYSELLRERAHKFVKKQQKMFRP
ncbi:MAG TPA: hypothetical protein VF538_02630 [Pyrinomonadaceae bacterium]|jgi:hypothetical protein